MFMRQAQAIDRLADHLGEDVTGIMREIFANGFQTLQHNGTVKFGSLTVAAGQDISGFSFNRKFGVAAQNWCKPNKQDIHPDEDPTTTITAEYLNVKYGDPNVEAGERVWYFEFADSKKVMGTGYLDRKIGTIVFSSATPRNGWANEPDYMLGMLPTMGSPGAQPPGMLPQHLHDPHEASQLTAHNLSERTNSLPGSFTMLISAGDWDSTEEHAGATSDAIWSGWSYTAYHDNPDGQNLPQHQDQHSDFQDPPPGSQCVVVALGDSGTFVESWNATSCTWNVIWGIPAPRANPPDWSVHEEPTGDNHTHPESTDPDDRHSHTFSNQAIQDYFDNTQNYTHDHSANATMPHTGQIPHTLTDNEPPYLAMAYQIRQDNSCNP